MVSLRGIALFIISTLLVTLIPLAILGIVVQPAVSASFFKGEFEKYDAYRRLHLELVQENPELESFITQDMVKTALDSFVDGMFAYLKGETDTLEIPDNNFLSGSPQIKSAMKQARDYYKLFSAALQALVAGIVLMFAAMVFLARKSKKDAAKWAGMTLLFAGVGGMVSAFAVQEYMPGLFSQVPAGSGTLVEVVILSIKDLVGMSMNALMVYSAAIAVPGLILYLYSWRLGKKK